MADEHARFVEGPDTVERLQHQVARLADLRRDGLRLVSEGDTGAIALWHRQWTMLLAEIGAGLDLEAPLQAEMVLWPAVNGTQPLGEIRVELVRATVGCRELELLVNQLVGVQSAPAETLDALPSPEEASQGATYVGGGQRFEGAVMLRKLIEAARDSLVIVDEYIGDGTFTLAAAAPDGISRRFLSSDHPARRGIAEAWASWRASWKGDSECRIGSGPHFRLLLVDGAAYHIDASLKDFGSKWTFFRMLPTDELRQIEGKIESMWRQATPV